MPLLSFCMGVGSVCVFMDTKVFVEEVSQWGYREVTKGISYKGMSGLISQQS